jgi:hypothetical protein
MATELCQKCKQTHPGRACDYDEKGDCSETVDPEDFAKALSQESKNTNDAPKSK